MPEEVARLLLPVPVAGLGKLTEALESMYATDFHQLTFRTDETHMIFERTVEGQ